MKVRVAQNGLVSIKSSIRSTHFSRAFSVIGTIGVALAVCGTLWLRSHREVKSVAPGDAPAFFSCTQPKTFIGAEFTQAVQQILGPEEAALVINPILITPEMKQWATEVTRSAGNDYQKAKILFDTLANRPNTQGVRFSSVATASEVFAHWGNNAMIFGCQDLAFFYVALARSIRLQAYYVYVEEDSNGMRLLHGCASVCLGRKAVLVDPGYARFGAPHRSFKVLDDVQATGIYLSSKGGQGVHRIACKLAPNLSLVRAGLFSTLVGEGKWEAAQAELSELIRLDPTGPSTYSAQAQMAFQSGNIQQAAELTRKGLLSAPQTGLLHFLMGRIHEHQRNFSEALQSFQSALQYAPNGAAIEQAKVAICYVNAHISYNIAYSRHRNGDLDGALAKLDEAIGLRPDFAEAYIARGITKQSKGLWEEAALDYDKSIQIRPDAQGYLGRANARYSHSDYGGAVADYKKALELDPGLLSAYRMVGCLHYDRHEFEQALMNLRKACAPGSIDDYAQFRIWLARSRLGQLSDATRELEAYLEMRNSPGEAWPLTIGRFLVGKMDEAEFLRSTKSVDTNQGATRLCEAFYYVGSRRLINSDPEGAADSFQKCVELKNNTVLESASAAAELRALRKAD